MEVNGARKRDRTKGILIVGSAFLAALTISWWANKTSMPPTSAQPEPPTVEGVLGYPNAVDPLEMLAAASALTERKELRGIVAVGVNQEGTVDVTKPGAHIKYVFQSRRGEGPQPAREHGTLPRQGYCGKQAVQIRADGISALADQPTYPCSAQHRGELPEPRCGPRELWRVAAQRRFPTNKPMRVEYYRANVGPAWRVEVPGTSHRMMLYGDCEREISGSDAFGSVP